MNSKVMKLNNFKSDDNPSQMTETRCTVANTQGRVARGIYDLQMYPNPMLKDSSLPKSFIEIK